MTTTGYGQILFFSEDGNGQILPSLSELFFKDTGRLGITAKWFERMQSSIFQRDFYGRGRCGIVRSIVSALGKLKSS